MAPITFDLVKRDEWCYYNCNGSWQWARWLLFVLFILGLLFVIATAFRINKRRGRQGIQPIRGTAWITPPSYFHSQQQNPPYVPQYTETANDNDMGYYDAQGVFHANTKYAEASTGNYHLGNLVVDQTGTTNTTNNLYTAPTSPPPAVHHQSQVTHTGDDEVHDFDRDFARYYGNSSSNNNNNNNEEEVPAYTSPPGPPPVAHTKN